MIYYKASLKKKKNRLQASIQSKHVKIDDPRPHAFISDEIYPQQKKFNKKFKEIQGTFLYGEKQILAQINSFEAQKEEINKQIQRSSQNSSRLNKSNKELTKETIEEKKSIIEELDRKINKASEAIKKNTSEYFKIEHLYLLFEGKIKRCDQLIKEQSQTLPLRFEPKILQSLDLIFNPTHQKDTSLEATEIDELTKKTTSHPRPLSEDLLPTTDNDCLTQSGKDVIQSIRELSQSLHASIRLIEKQIKINHEHIVQNIIAISENLLSLNINPSSLSKKQKETLLKLKFVEEKASKQELSKKLSHELACEYYHEFQELQTYLADSQSRKILPPFPVNKIKL